MIKTWLKIFKKKRFEKKLMKGYLMTLKEMFTKKNYQDPNIKKRRFRLENPLISINYDKKVERIKKYNIKEYHEKI